MLLITINYVCQKIKTIKYGLQKTINQSFEKQVCGFILGFQLGTRWCIFFPHRRLIGGHVTKSFAKKNVVGNFFVDEK